MRLFLILVLVTWSAKCKTMEEAKKEEANDSLEEANGLLDEANDLLNSFLSSVDISESKSFSNVQHFTSFTKSFLARSAPFSSNLLFLQGWTKKYERKGFLTLTKGIADKMESITARHRSLYGSGNNIISREYELEVELKLKKRLAEIEEQVNRTVIRDEDIAYFANQCNIGDNTPNAIALYLKMIVERCGKPRLSQAAETQLFNLINAMEYKEYAMPPDEERLFHKRFATVYLWLSTYQGKLTTLENFAHRNVVMNNKAAMLGALMKELGIKEDYTLCPVKDEFVANFYNRDTVAHFAELLMTHLTSLNYYTVICAYATYQEADLVEEYVSHVQNTLQSVYSFVINWYRDLLNSTWPITESLLIRNIIQDVSNGEDFSQNNQSYDGILDVVKGKMKSIGHPEYRRQYVVTGQRRMDDRSENFGFGCAPNACAISSTKHAHVVAIRTPVNDEERNSKLQKLVEFKNASWPVFFSAMNKHLYNFLFPGMVTDQLKHQYGLDLNQFTNHSSYVLLRKYRYFSGCRNAFTTGSDDITDATHLQTLHYHWDGSFPFKDCEDWLVIIG